MLIVICKANDNGQKERMNEIMEIKHKLETQDGAMQKYTTSQNDVILKLAGNTDILTTEIN